MKGNVFQAELTRWLKERDMTPLELCAAMDRCGVTVSSIAVTNWVEGRNQPQLRAARAVADALGCSLDDLYPSNLHSCAVSSSAA